MIGCRDLNVEYLRMKLDEYRNHSTPIPEEYQKKYKKAAVLISIVCIEGDWNLLFTKRAETLKNHRGQVSFPGGGFESIDENLVATALREANEEIGILSQSVQIIGTMPEFLTNSDFLVTPVVAVIDWPIVLSIAEAEVSKVFAIPISWLSKAENWEERAYTHPSGWHGTVVFFQPYEGEVLWGISAKITVELLSIILK